MINEFRALENLETVLTRTREIPTIVMWNRLEGRPRATDFARALRAEVRDPLWMLSRQWQMGEFRGEDAGSPVTAKVSHARNAVTHLRAGGGAVSAYDADTPLEAVTERLVVPLSQGPLVFALDQRLALGRQWSQAPAPGRVWRAGRCLRRRLPDSPCPTRSRRPTSRSPLTRPPGRRFAAVAGRAIDGGALLEHLRGAGSASDGLGLADRRAEFGRRAWPAVRGLGVGALRAATDSGGCLRGNRASSSTRSHVSAAKDEQSRAFVADEYHGGRLDWFAFDLATPASEFPAPLPGGQTTVTASFIPTGIQFDGMPNTRWWTFEEGAVNLGDVNPDTTDLSKLLLVEFGLVYANDWFLLPIALPTGSVADIEGLAVTNVFGERYWIEPSVSGPEESWRRWGMFKQTSRDAGSTDRSLLLLDTAPESLESAPVETVDLVRDEVSNMVWGIETVVQLPDGSSRRGREAALELRGRFEAALEATLAGLPASPDPAPNDATIRYELMNSVAENWIPFAPVQLAGDNREIQLQRSAMPRLLPGDPAPAPDKVRPRTTMLREGLDAMPRRPFYLAEEEVARAGVHVWRKWQRVRGRDGRVVLWLGMQRRTGRGEGSSGLQYDQMRPKPKA